MQPISVVTVSQLNRQVKSYLEQEIGLVHVEGEISNFSKPSSGHFYFTLKDSGAQLRCVFFKSRHIGPLVKTLGDGKKIVASGKLSLYEARGDYQLIVEQITDSGLGELYQRFEELKIKLAAEGLFHADRKKKIPLIPQAIGLITSTSGAAIQDMLSTLARRFPLAKVYIYPSEVQGATAYLQLIKALHQANADKKCDVLIIARGGGSIEDLWAFNNEQLARQIAASTIPIVSGVGHETDFTIADFVADYRAETPTAAATAVTPDSEELLHMLAHTMLRLHRAIHGLTQVFQVKLNHLMDKISSPQKAIATYWQSLDYLERRLLADMNQILKHRQHQIDLCLTRLHANNPKTQIAQTQAHLKQLKALLTQQIRGTLNQLKLRLSGHLSTLHAVSPLATLDRGYAIATKDDKVLYSSEEVVVGDQIRVRLARGMLNCEVVELSGS